MAGTQLKLKLVEHLQFTITITQTDHTCHQHQQNGQGCGVPSCTRRRSPSSSSATTVCAAVGALGPRERVHRRGSGERVVAVVLRDQFPQPGRHLLGQRLGPPFLDVDEDAARRRDAFLLVGVPEVGSEGPARRADARAARSHIDSVHGIVQRFMAPVEGDVEEHAVRRRHDDEGQQVARGPERPRKLL